MRGMEETFGMEAGPSVRKGKTAKQVRRARKNIEAAKKKETKKETKKSSPITDAVDRAGYKASGTKKSPTKTARRSADAYGSPAKARKGALGGLSPVLRAVTEAARDVASNIQNKAGDKAKMSMAQAYKAAQKTKGSKKK
jgi:hypothetical protein